MSRPTLTIIAGANGAGKTTLTAGSPGTFAAIPLLDPDAFANTLRSSGAGISAIAAGKEVLRLAKEHLERRESIAVETTLSGKNYLQMMQYARGIDRGFEVVPFRDPGRIVSFVLVGVRLSNNGDHRRPGV